MDLVTPRPYDEIKELLYPQGRIERDYALIIWYCLDNGVRLTFMRHHTDKYANPSKHNLHMLEPRIGNQFITAARTISFLPYLQPDIIKAILKSTRIMCDADPQWMVDRIQKKIGMYMERMKSEILFYDMSQLINPDEDDEVVMGKLV